MSVTVPTGLKSAVPDLGEGELFLTTDTRELVTSLGGSKFSTALSAFTETIVQFSRTDSTTKGDWIGLYGAQGYAIANLGQSVPSYASLSVSGSQFTWAGSTTDVRALKTPTGMDRIASCWFTDSSVQPPVVFDLDNGPLLRQVGLYFLDWDHLGRTCDIAISDAVTGAIYDTRSVTPGDGIYQIWNITGHVKIKMTYSGPAGINAVVSGLFFS